MLGQKNFVDFWRMGEFGIWLSIFTDLYNYCATRYILMPFDFDEFDITKEKSGGWRSIGGSGWLVSGD